MQICLYDYEIEMFNHMGLFTWNKAINEKTFFRGKNFKGKEVLVGKNICSSLNSLGLGFYPMLT